MQKRSPPSQQAPCGKCPRVPPADILSVARCDLVRPTWCLMTCRGDSQRVDNTQVFSLLRCRRNIWKIGVAALCEAASRCKFLAAGVHCELLASRARCNLYWFPVLFAKASPPVGRGGLWEWWRGRRRINAWLGMLQQLFCVTSECL